MNNEENYNGYHNHNNDNAEIFSKPVKAGKRTYFFDVKATRGNDYYLTITESKKRFGDDGKFHYEKHKLFLYKEDFEKFAGGLEEAINFIRSKMGDDFNTSHYNRQENGYNNTNYQQAPETQNIDHNAVEPQVTSDVTSDVTFEDLGNR
ncbi:MAG: DUF3276 family protein [Bacteroidia bacterium]